ncbi:MAG: T9SS type A sorting domain-containing protein [Aureispira sp.]|nr:T9SS type A sorting domain-containing protein [Aureispira sp.]
MRFHIKYSLLALLFSLGVSYSYAQCTLSATSSGGNASYTQVYVLVDDNGNIVAQNTTGTFTSIATGTYHIHALNYNPTDVPSPLPSALIGQPVANVGSTTTGCFNSDFLTDYVVRVCGNCQQSNTVCETDAVVATSSGGNASYTQLYVLADATTGLVVATNGTGTFTGMVSAGNSYRIYALNYNPADAPSPLPTVGQSVATVGSTTVGCFNSDFLTDYVCFNITNCATSCVKESNICENDDIIASSSGSNAGYIQVYVLTDDAGNFIAQNMTGVFPSTSLTLGNTYHVHALNYNPANPPSPLPSTLNTGDAISTITGGCFNSDFLTDYVCYTIGCPCDTKLVQYAPDQASAGGMGVQYTMATAYCEEASGWRYYYDPNAPDDLLFAIEHKPAGGNTADFTAQVTIGVNDYSTTTGYDEPIGGQDLVNFEANFGMGRYWDVDVTSGSLNGPVNVRFFYKPDEFAIANNAAAAWKTANEPAAILAGYAGLQQLSPYWFKTNDATAYNPAPDLEPTTVNSGNIIVLNSNFTGVDAIGIHNTKNYVQFDGQISSFSGGTAAFRVTPIPIILDNATIGFSGWKVGDKNELEWTIDNEQTIQSYTLERSTDGIDFQTLAAIDAVGQSAYNYIDELPYSTSYYRLKVKELDGQISYSNVINLTRKGITAGSIKVYPNPTTNSVNIDFLADKSSNATIQVIDVLGRTLQTIETSVELGANRKIIDLSMLSDAVYILSIKTEDAQFTRKITKTH